MEDIAAGLSMHRAEALKHVEALAAEGLVERSLYEANTLFRIASGSGL